MKRITSACKLDFAELPNINEEFPEYQTSVDGEDLWESVGNITRDEDPDATQKGMSRAAILSQDCRMAGYNLGFAELARLEAMEAGISSSSSSEDEAFNQMMASLPSHSGISDAERKKQEVVAQSAMELAASGQLGKQSSSKDVMKLKEQSKKGKKLKNEKGKKEAEVKKPEKRERTLDDIYDEVAARPDVVEMLDWAKSQGRPIRTEVAIKEDVPYYLQADLLMYTEEALRERKRLKASRPIKDEIKLWWQGLGKEKLNAQLTKKEFIDLYMNLAPVLLTNRYQQVLFSEQALEDAAEEEWILEMKDSPSMSFDRFYDAIFELVDVWTAGLDEVTYINFLRFVWRGVLKQAEKKARRERPLAVNMLKMAAAFKPAPVAAPEPEEEQEEEQDETEEGSRKASQHSVKKVTPPTPSLKPPSRDSLPSPPKVEVVEEVVETGEERRARKKAEREKEQLEKMDKGEMWQPIIPGAGAAFLESAKSSGGTVGSGGLGEDAMLALSRAGSKQGGRKSEHGKKKKKKEKQRETPPDAGLEDSEEPRTVEKSKKKKTRKSAHVESKDTADDMEDDRKWLDEATQRSLGGSGSDRDDHSSIKPSRLGSRPDGDTDSSVGSEEELVVGADGSPVRKSRKGKKTKSRGPTREAEGPRKSSPLKPKPPEEKEKKKTKKKKEKEVVVLEDGTVVPKTPSKKKRESHRPPRDSGSRVHGLGDIPDEMDYEIRSQGSSTPYEDSVVTADSLSRPHTRESRLQTAETKISYRHEVPRKTEIFSHQTSENGDPLPVVTPPGNLGEMLHSIENVVGYKKPKHRRKSEIEREARERLESKEQPRTSAWGSRVLSSQAAERMTDSPEGRRRHLEMVYSAAAEQPEVGGLSLEVYQWGPEVLEERRQMSPGSPEGPGILDVLLAQRQANPVGTGKLPPMVLRRLRLQRERQERAVSRQKKRFKAQQVYEMTKTLSPVKKAEKLAEIASEFVVRADPPPALFPHTTQPLRAVPRTKPRTHHPTLLPMSGSQTTLGNPQQQPLNWEQTWFKKEDAYRTPGWAMPDEGGEGKSFLDILGLSGPSPPDSRSNHPSAALREFSFQPVPASPQGVDSRFKARPDPLPLPTSPSLPPGSQVPDPRKIGSAPCGPSLMMAMMGPPPPSPLAGGELGLNLGAVAPLPAFLPSSPRLPSPRAVTAAASTDRHRGSLPVETEQQAGHMPIPSYASLRSSQERDSLYDPADAREWEQQQGRKPDWLVSQGHAAVKVDRHEAMAQSKLPPDDPLRPRGGGGVKPTRKDRTDSEPPTSFMADKTRDQDQEEQLGDDFVYVPLADRPKGAPATTTKTPMKSRRSTSEKKAEDSLRKVDGETPVGGKTSPPSRSPQKSPHATVRPVGKDTTLAPLPKTSLHLIPDARESPAPKLSEWEKNEDEDSDDDDDDVVSLNLEIDDGYGGDVELELEGSSRDAAEEDEVVLELPPQTKNQRDSRREKRPTQESFTSLEDRESPDLRDSLASLSSHKPSLPPPPESELTFDTSPHKQTEVVNFFQKPPLDEPKVIQDPEPSDVAILRTSGQSTKDSEKDSEDPTDQEAFQKQGSSMHSEDSLSSARKARPAKLTGVPESVSEAVPELVSSPTISREKESPAIRPSILFDLPEEHASRMRTSWEPVASVGGVKSHRASESLGMPEGGQPGDSFSRRSSVGSNLMQPCMTVRAYGKAFKQRPSQFDSMAVGSQSNPGTLTDSIASALSEYYSNKRWPQTAWSGPRPMAPIAGPQFKVLLTSSLDEDQNRPRILESGLMRSHERPPLGSVRRQRVVELRVNEDRTRISEDRNESEDEQWTTAGDQNTTERLVPNLNRMSTAFSSASAPPPLSNRTGHSSQQNSPMKSKMSSTGPANMLPYKTGKSLPEVENGSPLPRKQSPVKQSFGNLESDHATEPPESQSPSLPMLKPSEKRKEANAKRTSSDTEGMMSKGYMSDMESSPQQVKVKRVTKSLHQLSSSVSGAPRPKGMPTSRRPRAKGSGGHPDMGVTILREPVNPHKINTNTTQLNMSKVSHLPPLNLQMHYSNMYESEAKEGEEPLRQDVSAYETSVSLFRKLSRTGHKHLLLKGNTTLTSKGRHSTHLVQKS